MRVYLKKDKRKVTHAYLGKYPIRYTTCILKPRVCIISIAPTNLTPTNLKIHQPPSLHLTIRKHFLITSMMPNSDHIRFGIVMKLALNQMGDGNEFFAHKSGAMLQGYGTVKLGSMNPYDAHSSFYHRKMGSASCLPW